MDFDGVKVTYAKNIEKHNFSLVVSLPIDNNANIKTILNVSSHLFDEKVECAAGKAVVSGKVGVKVLYIDTDNITNTVTDSLTFSEQIADSNITADCFLNLGDVNLVNSVLESAGALKINCDITFAPTLYLNLALPQNNTFENLIVKKSEITTNTIAGFVNTNFDYTTNFETKDSISKVLYYNAYFTPNSVAAFDGYAVVEGKLFAQLVYETAEGEETKIKELTDNFNLKSEVRLDGVDKDCALDLTFALDKSKFNLNTEIEDNNCVVTVTHTICARGAMLKPVALDLVDDVYSVDNEVETSLTSREFLCEPQKECAQDSVSGEISLADNEPAIDEIVCNLDIQPELTNTYIKDGEIFVEGLVSSQLVYVDENKECRTKNCELPFVINTKIQAESAECAHAQISVCDCRAKAKRGTIIELEYALNICVCCFQKQTHEMIDNINLGKPLNFSEYDYQIFLAKPNETMWQLCKRIKTTPDNLQLFNKDLPPILDGGEKIIIKR